MKWLLNRKFMPFLFSYFHVYADVRLRQVTTSVGHENSLWVLIFKSHVLPQSPKFLGLCRFIFRTQSLLFENNPLAIPDRKHVIRFICSTTVCTPKLLFFISRWTPRPNEENNSKEQVQGKEYFPSSVVTVWIFFTWFRTYQRFFCTRVASNSKKETNLHGILLIGNSNKFTLNTFRPWAGCNQQPIFFYLFLFPF